MWPWGHFAVAYLLYSLYARGRFRRPPRPAPALAVAVGSQLPDLIDKPLAWWFGVLPSGRSLAHSLLFAAGLLAVVYIVAFVLDRVETATAIAVGHLSHLATDLPPRVAFGFPFGSEYLLWPVLTPRTFWYRERVFDPPAVVESVAGPLLDPATFFTLQVVLFGLALALWVIDGRPGVAYVRTRFHESGFESARRR